MSDVIVGAVVHAALSVNNTRYLASNMLKPPHARPFCIQNGKFKDLLCTYVPGKLHSIRECADMIWYDLFFRRQNFRQDALALPSLA